MIAMYCASNISTYTPYITGFGGVIAGAIGSYFVGVKLSQKNHDKAIALMKRQEFFIAASKFKAIVIRTIGVLYDPFSPNQIWVKKDFHRLYRSIPRINSAAAEFRYFVASKVDFDKAVSEYNQYCRDNTENMVFKLDYPVTMPGDKTKKDYMDQFYKIVEVLLSFTNCG
jgi:hypothetical protein